MNTKPPTKTEVREWIKDIREALRYTEKALAEGDWEQVVEGLGFWAAPSAATISEMIEEARNIQR